MGTSVDERVDSELTALVENDDEVPCVAGDDPATHSATLECGCSFVVCDRHTRRIRLMAEIKKVAKCWHCRREVALKSLNPI